MCPLYWDYCNSKSKLFYEKEFLFKCKSAIVAQIEVVLFTHACQAGQISFYNHMFWVIMTFYIVFLIKGKTVFT